MPTDRLIKRRRFLGAGGLAAASALGVGAVGLGASPAHASSLRVVEHQDYGRLQYYRFSTPSIGWKPAANVLLPEGYDRGKRYPVLYLLHGGLGDFREFHRFHDIIGLTAGKDLIVVMPDGGKAGWYCNPATVGILAGPRNWETFHMSELLPWVEANFSTHAEYAGRAVSGFSMGGFGALKYTAKYYGHFASVSSHSGPASLRRDHQRLIRYMNVSSAAVETGGRPVYGFPWRQNLISADNPVERIESYRNKRIFLVSGTDRSTMFDGKINMPSLPWEEFMGAVQEQHVADGQREFGALLQKAGIHHQRYEEPGGHFVRGHRLREDIEGIVKHLKPAG